MKTLVDGSRDVMSKVFRLLTARCNPDAMSNVKTPKFL